MRIQTFDPDFNMLDDRLVSQDTELYKGPTSTHLGPLKVEFSLFDKDDVDACITYIKKLKGDLPIELKVKKPKSPPDSDSDEGRERLLYEVTEATTQEAAIKILREEGFVFLTAQDVEDYGVFPLSDADKNFEWMVKLTREAKDPANNKYDPTVRFGFKIMGPKVESYILYNFDKRYEKELPWKSSKEFNFKKVNLTKYHSAMVEEERLKFSKELAKLRKDPELEPSKFFKRWAPYADFTEKEEWATRLQ